MEKKKPLKIKMFFIRFEISEDCCEGLKLGWHVQALTISWAIGAHSISTEFLRGKKFSIMSLKFLSKILHQRF